MRPSDLDKLILDVQNGLYPINGMEVSTNAANPKQIEPEPPNVTFDFDAVFLVWGKLMAFLHRKKYAEFEHKFLNG